MELVRVRTEWTGLVQGGGLSTHYFTRVGSVEGTEYTDLVFDFWTACNAQLVNDVQWSVNPNLDVIEDTTGDLVDFLVGGPAVTTAGGNSTDNLAAPLQTLLRLSTGAVVGSRRLQGRLFIPGPPAASVGATNGPTAASRTAYQTAAAGLITASSTPGPWRIWSRPVAAAGGVAARAGSSAPVTGATTWEKFAVLRSRRD